MANRHGYASTNSSLESLLDQADFFFIENAAAKRVWIILDLIYDKTESLRTFQKENRLGADRRGPIQELENYIAALRSEYEILTPLLEVHDDLEICLQWLEIDYQINQQLRHDGDLVDVSRTHQSAGIKICLGAIRNLLTITKGE